jgi:hypothetical protein
MKLYRYVGPEEIRLWTTSIPGGARIESAHDLDNWLHRTGQKPNPEDLFVVTFVIDEEGHLLVAERASEHVACAGNRPVLSAGEMFLRRSEKGVQVERASNQSTGFCPEPESWQAVASALDRIGLTHPGRFTEAVVFRRCLACGERNIVKDGWFMCAICGAELPSVWNF